MELQKEMNDANSLLGLGWRLPDSLELKEIGDKMKLSKDNKEFKYEAIRLLNGKTKLLQLPGQITDRIFWSLANEAKGYTGTNKTATKIDVDNSNWGSVKYATGNVFSNAFWGYLLTALAISLGSPFWFDILNKLVQIRGSVKEPPRSVKS